MKKLETKKIYLNKAQQYLYYIAPKNLIAIASRRFGKSEGIIMPRLLQNVQSMPKSNTAIVGNSYKQILTRTLPATMHALGRLGYYEDIHFVIGKKAPKNLNFAEPYIKPRDWDYIIHWYNGSINTLISQDIRFSSNSLTLDGIIGDEAKTLDYNQLATETFPANSGLHHFRDNPWHTGFTFVTDMPDSNSWLFKYEKLCDKNVIKVIESLIVQISELKNRVDSNIEPIEYKIIQLEKELNFFRSKLTLFVEYSILENLEYVGIQYIEDQFRNLDPYDFKTQLLTMRAKNHSGKFYAALNTSHQYIAINNDFLNSFRKSDNTIDWRTASTYIYDCKLDTDIDYSMPLCIAFDTNINVNWLVVGQPNYQDNILKTIKSFHVKNGKMLPEVIKIFDKYYKPLHNKRLVFYYDHTFLQGKSATNSETFKDTIVREFSALDWYIIPVYIGQAERHDIKHKNIDLALKGIRGLKPLFNKYNNSNLLIALDKAGTKIGQNGWGKDKSKEKEPDSENNPIEHRTDATDAFDTLWIGCNNFPFYNYITEIKLNTELI